MSLNITPDAAVAIRSLLSDREGGGLRISPIPNDDNGSRFELKLTLSEQPETTDEVVAQHGSMVFIEKRLSSVLADKTLDVTDGADDRHIAFRLVS